VGIAHRPPLWWALPTTEAIAELGNFNSKIVLVCYVEILTNTKNSYTLGPFLTNESGEVVFTVQLILDTINDWMSQYPMDYTSDISGCKDELIVKIHNIESLKERVKILERFYPDEAEKLRYLFECAHNDRLVTDFQNRYQVSESIKVSLPLYARTM
jgi:hypothetical protein